MNDEFLTRLRAEPDPEFADALHERINGPMDNRKTPAIAPARRGWVTGLAAAAALVLLFCFPGVRAAAQDFLDLFRVKRFAAVPFDPDRIDKLRNGDLDIQTLLANDVERLKEPGEPVQAASAAEAGQLAGITVLAPATLPPNTAEQPEIRVRGEAATRLTADAAKLRAILDTVGATDVDIPAGLDGATVTVDVPPAVMMRYARGTENITVMQSRSPEVTLPRGVDLAQLGELGLRAAGMSADEAHTFAQSVDWHGTLLVPVPANAASFREVTVRGTSGLLVTTGGRGGTAIRSDNGDRQRSLVLWSENGMVYAVSGGATSVDILATADSMR